MNEIGCIGISCCHCVKKLSKDDIYIFEGKHMCDDCAIKAGLFPLEHTGARRDKISERGRRLTIRKP